MIAVRVVGLLHCCGAAKLPGMDVAAWFRLREASELPTPPRFPYRQVGKAYAARCSKALNKKDAVALQEEGFERLEAVFAKGLWLGLQKCVSKFVQRIEDGSTVSRQVPPCHYPLGGRCHPQSALN